MINNFKASNGAQKWLKSEEGASVAEFALVLPILITLIFVIFDMGIMMVIKSTLQTGVTAAARSDSTSASSTPASVITQYASGFINSSFIVTTIQSYPTFSAVAGSNPKQLGTVTPGASGVGSAGSIVKYQAQYTYTPVSPLTAQMFGSTKLLTVITYGKNGI